MSESTKNQSVLRSFPGIFWLVIIFEFFERGAYYGMMSFISVYFDDVLGFPKESIGVIKGVIQPLLYFMPIISGALADRFGYRRLLMVAFSLLGGGYFLTSQTTTYGAVFASLVIMGIGAGVFKPLISGTIAKVTDENNSAMGFGIFYWSINVGAFIFPLILVPFLKAMNPTYVIIASAICTALMIIPTALFFKDPARAEKAEKRKQMTMIQTLANAFEIIYSPIVLLYFKMKKSLIWRIIIGTALILLFGYALSQYSTHSVVTSKYSQIGINQNDAQIVFNVDRNMFGKENYKVEMDDSGTVKQMTIYKPTLLNDYSNELIGQFSTTIGFETMTQADIEKWIETSDQKITLDLIRDSGQSSQYALEQISEMHFQITIGDYEGFPTYGAQLLAELHQYPILRGITLDDCLDLHNSAGGRSFFLLFVMSLIIIGLIIIGITQRQKSENTDENKQQYPIPFIISLVIGAVIWVLPGLSLLGRIIASVIYFTITSLFIIDKSSQSKFSDHAKFLLMIFLYAGFWVLYFQMFDSVLWYVKAYVDATPVNDAINGFLGVFGISTNWFFDVEHVTVINALCIILLQLIISRMVKNTKALPTMMFGIALGTIGMAILAINTNIWVFLAGIAIFSIGEMTAHPKFISYIGLVAPQDRKAMYMGYLFLYGVFGSSIGGILGAKLYVHFVDNLNMPRTLWLVFAGIGVYTIVALALYNRFLKPHTDTE